jgi:hypothetical protein
VRDREGLLDVRWRYRINHDLPTFQSLKRSPQFYE